MTDDRTAHLSLPLPHPGNDLSDDVTRLRAALAGLDAAYSALSLTDSQLATDLEALGEGGLNLAQQQEVAQLLGAVINDLEDLAGVVESKEPALSNREALDLIAVEDGLPRWNGAAWPGADQAGTLMRPVVDLGAVASSGSETVDVDLSLADYFVVSMVAANTSGTLTLDFKNVPDTALGGYVSWYVELLRGGRKSVTFAQAFTWAGGVAPALGTQSSAADVLWFYKRGDNNLRVSLIDAR